MQEAEKTAAGPGPRLAAYAGKASPCPALPNPPVLSSRTSGELDVTHAAALVVAVSAAVASVPQIAVDLTPRRPTDAVPAALPFWRLRWII